MALFALAPLLLLAGLASGNQETDLRKLLLTDYDRNAMPGPLTNVSVRFTVLNLDIDAENQAMQLDSWISMEWEDPRLMWEKDQYPEVDKLSFGPHQIWRPDFTLYNNAQMDKADPLGDTLVLNYNTGRLMHVPMALLQASCILDMTSWPQDVHNCTAKFGSWVHSGLVLDLTPKDNGAEVEFELMEKNANGNYQTRGGWEVLSNNVERHVKYYKCCSEPYVDLTVNIIVRRNVPVYNWLVKLPAIAICILTGLLFLMPPASVSKILMGTFIVFLEMQFMSLTWTISASSPAHTPLIVQLMGEQLVLTLVCVIISVIIVRLVSDPPCDPLPGWLKRPVSIMGSCFCLGGYRKMVTSAVDGAYPRSMKGKEVDMSEESGMVGHDGARGGLSAEQAEWLLLGAILDRVFFSLYLVSLMCKAITFCGIF